MFFFNSPLSYVLYKSFILNKQFKSQLSKFQLCHLYQCIHILLHGQMKVQGLPPWPANVSAETKKKNVTACASGSGPNFKQLSQVQYTNTMNIVHRNPSLSGWTWYSIYYVTVIQPRLYFRGCRYVFIRRVITGDLCGAFASETGVGRVQETYLWVLSFALLMESGEAESPRSSVHSAPVMLISVSTEIKQKGVWSRTTSGQIDT